MQNNDLIGKVVLSKAGRDKNHLYVVINSLDNEYVLLCNGKTKGIRNPKKKKLKHLVFFNEVNDEIRSAILNQDSNTDLQIKRFLKLKGIVKEG